MAELLGDAFTGEAVADPTEDGARACLQAVEGSTARTAPRAGWTRSVVEPCALSGASQILVIVDICFSGGAVRTRCTSPRR